MLRFLIKRAFAALVILVAISGLTYGLIYLAPGDPAMLIVARRIGHLPSQAEMEAVSAAYRLDRPIIVQYATWLAGVVRGDLGISMRSGSPVADEIWRRTRVTLLLASVATSFAVLAGVGAGVLSTIRPGSIWDQLSRGIALASVSIPNFWLAFVLILVFSIQLGWLPAFGLRGPASLVLPVLAVGLPNAAYLSRLTRSVLLETRTHDYVRTARAKGLSERAVWLGHALPNAAPALITLVMLQFSAIAAGSVIIETVFAWPGVGSYFIAAVEYRDLPAIQASVLWFATLVLGVNILADLLAGIVDPRLRIA